jgi:hypothetical protein
MVNIPNRPPRRHRAPADAPDLAQRLRDLHTEAGGVFEQNILRKERDAPALPLGVTAGVPRVVALCRALNIWIDGLKQCDRICFNPGCNHAFEANAIPPAFLVAAPYRGDVRRMLIAGVCGACAVANSDTEIALWLQRIWGDGRIIAAPRTEAGRA